MPILARGKLHVELLGSEFPGDKVEGMEEFVEKLAKAVRDGVQAGRLDVCCHGWRWEDHIAMGEAEERERIARAVASLTATLGAPPPTEVPVPMHTSPPRPTHHSGAARGPVAHLGRVLSQAPGRRASFSLPENLPAKSFSARIHITDSQK